MNDGPLLLDALLDSWDRNQAIVIHLLRALPASSLEARATPDGPTVAQLFHHIHFVRMILVEENAPELAGGLPAEEWADERDTDRMARLLDESARIVRVAVRDRVQSGRGMDQHFDHPILLLQHMIWHEGYHHGQIKLALKLAGRPLPDDEAGPLSWDLWMHKTSPTALQEDA